MVGRFARVVFAMSVAATLAASPALPSITRAQRAAPPVASSESFDIVEKSIPELQDAMASRSVTSRQLVTAYLARIAAYDQKGPRLNAMIALNPRALDVADALDKERSDGRVRGPLHGVPVVIKDNYETSDMATTGGSIALAGFMPGRDAYQVKRLRDAGAVVIGKTNLHELARGITTVSSISGQTRNPYDPARNPGGSSGGTGAAVAANFAAAGMGSDTCGSIRIPSANNNLFGLRPTMGLSSRQGIIPLSHTQDVGGPLTRTVTDLAIMLDATTGTDSRDEITREGENHRPASYRDSLDKNALEGVRIGVVKSLFGAAPEDTEGGDVVRKALGAMRDRGAVVIDVVVPGLESVLQGSSVINAEFKFDFSDYLAHYPHAPVHSLSEILERGDYHSSLEPGFRQSNAVESRETEAYRAALRRRAVVRDLIMAAFEEQKVETLAYPVLTRKAAIIGEPVRGLNNCQVSASTALPAISIPAGFTADGLPIGVELLGRPWSEPRLLSIAYAYEQSERPRRAPPTTPPLVKLAGANATASRRIALTLGNLRSTFVFDPSTGRLSYEAISNGPTGTLAAAVHRGAEGKTGPVILPILLPTPTGATPTAGEAVLLPGDREALEKGELYLAIRSDAVVLRAQLRSQ